MPSCQLCAENHISKAVGAETCTTVCGDGEKANAGRTDCGEFPFPSV